MQAGLNIARWRAFITDKNLGNVDGEKQLTNFITWYKEQISNNWNEKIELIDTQKIPQTIRSNRA